MTFETLEIIHTLLKENLADKVRKREETAKKRDAAEMINEVKYEFYDALAKRLIHEEFAARSALEEFEAHDFR